MCDHIVGQIRSTQSTHQSDFDELLVAAASWMTNDVDLAEDIGKLIEKIYIYNISQFDLSTSMQNNSYDIQLRPCLSRR